MLQSRPGMPLRPWASSCKSVLPKPGCVIPARSEVSFPQIQPGKNVPGGRLGQRKTTHWMSTLRGFGPVPSPGTKKCRLSSFADPCSGACTFYSLTLAVCFSPCAKLRKAISDLLLLSKHTIRTSHASHVTTGANELQADSHRIAATAGRSHSFPFCHVLPRQRVPSSDHTFSCG